MVDDIVGKACTSLVNMGIGEVTNEDCPNQKVHSAVTLLARYTHCPDP